MEKIKLGIIGIGNMGSGHASNIKDGKCPEIELLAIADSNPERLGWAKQQNYAEDIAYFDNAVEMLDSGIINACLRLKMIFGEQVAFDLEGEQGAGTTVSIRMPVERGDGKDGGNIIKGTAGG